MGISGLLPVLKSITETKDIAEYRGQTLAIDGYCWLHRAIYSCSQEICLGQETDKYIVYFIDRVQALIQNGVIPYVVFDGGPLPMKKGTEEERRKARAKNRELGVELYRQRKFAEARKCFVRAADVSPYMAHRVIQRLKRMNVLYVVAPYEADAQLAFLVKNGLADGVITEDSDCIPFGCEKVLFKMDRDGVAQEVQTVNLKRNTGLSFHMFSDDMFLEMCIFSGCDYLSSLPGFGLKKAYALVKQHGSIAKVIRAVRLEGKVRIPPTYEADFERAMQTFRHQRVYDPRSKTIVPLTPIFPDLLEKDAAMDFLGPAFSHDHARAIAEGDMDPMTMTYFSSSQGPQPSVTRDVPSHAQPLEPPQQRCETKDVVQTTQTTATATKSAAEVASVRRLPGWMSTKRSPLYLTNKKGHESKHQHTTMASTSASPVSTPRTISHFFAAQAKKCSPLVESSSCKLSEIPQTPTANDDDDTYESQEATTVDVARSVSFSPQDDENKHTIPHGMDTSRVEKENRLPNASGTQNAFSRMMQAGSLSKNKRSLKRKALGFSGRTGHVFGRGLGGHHHENAVERIKKHAFTVPGTVKSLAVSGPKMETETEKLSAVDSSSTEIEVIEVASQDESKASLGVVRQKQPRVVEDSTTVRRTKSSVDAFARFRFQKS